MVNCFSLYPKNPQTRLINQAVACLHDGAIIVYPTDSCYALGCRLGDKSALDRIRQIRQLPASRHMTLVCRDLSDIATYAHVSNPAFRMIKSMTPGPYTFILPAKRDVPKRLQHPKKRTIGIRIPDNLITLAFLSTLGQAITSISLVLPGNDLPETEPEIIKDKIGNQIDLVIDGGTGSLDYTTVIDMSGKVPVIVRKGKIGTGMLKDLSG